MTNQPYSTVYTVFYWAYMHFFKSPKYTDGSPTAYTGVLLYYFALFE